MAKLSSVIHHATDAVSVLQAQFLPKIDVLKQPPVGAEDVQIIWPRFYDWPDFKYWCDSIRQGLAALEPITLADDFPQVRGVVTVAFVHRGRRRLIALDTGDTSAIDPALPEKYFLYFKMQYARAGYAWPNVVSGGYIPRGTLVYRHLPVLRKLRDAGRFRHTVHGRFGDWNGSGHRREFLSHLAQDDRFAFSGGIGLRRETAFLREVARSRICIDLHGQGDFCFRLVEYMAIGSCIVAARHRTRLPVDLIDGEDIIFVDSPKEMADTCAVLLEDEARVERIAQASRRYFDRHLTRRALASYYLRTFLDKIAAE